MPNLLKNDKLKIKILEVYKKENISYTASLLSNIVKSKYQTVKNALEFFYCLGAIEKETKKHGKKSYTYYNLNKVGEILVDSIKK